MRDTFKDHPFRVASGSEDKEEGKSIKLTDNLMYRFDIDGNEWFAYDDNFGTSEEKALIKYIEGKWMPCG